MQEADLVNVSIKRKPVSRATLHSGDLPEDHEEAVSLISAPSVDDDPNAEPQGRSTVSSAHDSNDSTVLSSTNARPGSQQVHPSSLPQRSATATSDEKWTGLIDTHGVDKEKDFAAASTTSESPKFWNSRWLHTVTLLSFALVFVAMLVALILLYHFAKMNNGLSTQLSSNHYAWTYGPTALLVIFLSVWRQVDFACRILAPWKHASDKPCKVDESLLMDYIAPILPSRLWTALRNHDWAVCASSTAVMFLRLVIIFSTGLLVLSPTQESSLKSPLIIDSGFVGKTYSEISSSNSGDEAMMTYYGILRQGLQYPFGSNETFAYETINVRSPVENSTIDATVSGFYPYLDCTTMPVTTNVSWTTYADGDDFLEITYKINQPDCPPIIDGFSNGCQPLDGDCPASQIVSDFMQGESQGPESNIDGSSTTVPDKCYAFWSWTVAQISYHNVNDTDANSTSAWDVRVTDLATTTCYPSYSIQPVDVSIDITNFTQLAGVQVSTSYNASAYNQLPGFSALNFSSILSLENVAVGAVYGFNDTLSLLLLPSPEITETDLLNSSTLTRAAEEALKGLGAQVAHGILREVQRIDTNGTVIFSEQRLQVRLLMVWVMSAGFIALTVCAILVMLFRPRDAITRDPNSIATHAAVLGMSPELRDLLLETRHLKTAKVRMATHNLRFYSNILATRGAHPYTIQVHRPDNTTAPQVANTEGSHSFWWFPLSMTAPFMIWVLSIPVIVIIVLEVLQHYSDLHQGITNVSVSSLNSHSAASVLSSLIMIVIAISYDTVEFAMFTFGPFRTLRKGAATATRCLFRNGAGQVPLVSIFNAFQNRTMLVAAAAFAATIASFLTVIASGLYTVDSVQYASQITITAADSFGTYWNSSSYQSEAAGQVFGLIEHENASYPAYTFNELAFPALAINDAGLPREVPDSEYPVQVSLPARRGALNCTIVPPENITLKIDLNALAVGHAYFTQYTFLAGVPESCTEYSIFHPSDIPIDAIPLRYSEQWSTPNDTTYTAQIGQMLGRLTSLSTSGLGIINDYNSGIDANTDSPSCPSLGFVFGLFNQQNINTESVTGMLCVQGLEEVQTTTTFDYAAEMTVLDVVVHEDTARWIATEDYVGTFFGPIQLFRDYDSSSPLDAFTQTLIYGTKGTPFNELAGYSNAERLFTSVQHVYRKYMAQAINENMRINFTSANANAAPVYTGRLPDASTQLRLVQNRTSTTILEVFLGVICASGIAVYAVSFGECRRLLPRCPWSMAGMMTLLAGSEMCGPRVMPGGAESMTDKELETALQGWLFSLGWWVDGRDERYGIDVGSARKGRGGCMTLDVSRSDVDGG